MEVGTLNTMFKAYAPAEMAKRIAAYGIRKVQLDMAFNGRGYDVDELTPELLRLFIQRIEVGERTEKYSRSSHQSIRIVYRDIGTVDSEMEQGEAQPRIAPPLSEVFELPA